jgi:hypothetical protein
MNEYSHYFAIGVKFSLSKDSDKFREYLLSLEEECYLSIEQTAIISDYIKALFDKIMITNPETVIIENYFTPQCVDELKDLPKLYNFAFGFYDEQKDNMILKSYPFRCTHDYHMGSFKNYKTERYDFFVMKNILCDDFDFYLGKCFDNEKQYDTSRIIEDFICGDVRGKPKVEDQKDASEATS